MVQIIMSGYARISIHALLAESDICVLWMVLNRPLFLSTLSLRRATMQIVIVVVDALISIHALLAESDCCGRCHCWGLNEFLSTLSLRRATMMLSMAVIPISFLSTLSLRRATGYGQHCIRAREISIHALLAESDRLWTTLYSCPGNFYPRSPCGERPDLWVM